MPDDMIIIMASLAAFAMAGSILTKYLGTPRHCRIAPLRMLQRLIIAAMFAALLFGGLMILVREQINKMTTIGVQAAQRASTRVQQGTLPTSSPRPTLTPSSLATRPSQLEYGPTPQPTPTPFKP